MIDKRPASEKQNQRSAWTRILDILLRSAHVLVISGLFGGAVFKVWPDQLVEWRYGAILSGLGLIVSEVAHQRHWPAQARGLMVYLHAGLLGLAVAVPSLAVPCLGAAIVTGMIGSHMPKKLRYWSFIYGRVVD